MTRLDLPARLLSFALRGLSHERQDWGRALWAELAQIEAPLERWSFAMAGAGLALQGLPLLLREHPRAAALLGAASLLPFLLCNAIVANQIDPFFSWIRPGPHTSPQEYILLAFVLLLLPAGAACALLPTVLVGVDGKRRFYYSNGAMAALLLLVFGVLSMTLGTEIYRCDVLKIPYCD